LTLQADNQDQSEASGFSKAGAERMVEAVKWFILSEELIPKQSIVLAAISGGQDSMAMLSILHLLHKELDFGLMIAHFDHRLRTSGEQDRLLVEEFTKSRSLELITGSQDVAELAAASGDTIEEAARKARYEFLYHCANECEASRIATGHTKDDQIETVVMRMMRGCGLRGLAGIPVQRGKLIRPLLATGREDTHAYCIACNISPAIDPSNEDPQFFRNRIRLEVLPFLRTIQPSVDENLLRLSENAGKLIRSIRDKTQPLLKRHSHKLSDCEWKLNVAKLSSIDDTSLVVLFGDLFTEQMQLDMDFTQPHFDQLVRLARNASASGKMLSLPHLQAKREFENLIFTVNAAKISPQAPGTLQVPLNVPGRTIAGEAAIVTEILNKDELSPKTFKATENEAYFTMDRITEPLIIRNPLPGDRMQPFGMKGSKKLSDIFVDRKIPGRERPRKMVLCDADGILWLIGLATTERGRIDEKTQKILKITVQRE
jgi:tRNA(Ile)-lysidine synthase